MTEDERESMEQLKAVLSLRIAEAKRREWYQGRMEDIRAEKPTSITAKPMAANECGTIFC